MRLKNTYLSARTKINDFVLGLNLGANDYLTKPFDFTELEARTRNLLSRKFHQEKQILTNDLLCLDTSSKQVTYNHQLINLTQKEYRILEYLTMHPNIVVSAETLTEHVWTNDYY